MTMWRLFWFSLLVGLVGYGMIALWAMPRIDAGGLPIPELHPAGYDLEDMRRFLSALTDAGRAAYLGPERLADTLFPIGLAGALGSGICLVFRRRNPGLAAALALLPLAYLVVDMMENAALARLLRGGAQALTPEAVARASALTVWKYRLIGASVIALLVGLALNIPKKTQERRENALYRGN